MRRRKDLMHLKVNSPEYKALWNRINRAPRQKLDQPGFVLGIHVRTDLVAKVCSQSNLKGEK